MNAAAESCSNCRFWYKDQAGTFCRRFPPTSSFVPGTAITPPTDFTAWPRTLPAWWCGEWKSDQSGGGLLHAIPLVRTNQPEDAPGGAQSASLDDPNPPGLFPA